MDIWIKIFLVLIALSVLLFIIALIVLLFTTGLKKSGRMMGGLYCLTAPPGNGKSYVATHLAIDFLKQGRKVFSNYPIVYNDGRTQLQTKALTKNMLLEKNLNGSVIIIDEAHTWFWSRKFKEFTEEYKNWFSTLSQHEISLYYIVQHEDRVDTVINDCANLFGQIEKYEVPILDMPLFFIITWWNRELDLQMSRTRTDIDPFHVERIWFNLDVAQSFDTKFFGSDKREPYEGVDWVLWMKKEWGFDYKGNYNFSFKSRIINFFFNSYVKIKNIIREKMIVSPLAGTEGAVVSQIEDLFEDEKP